MRSTKALLLFLILLYPGMVFAQVAGKVPKLSSKVWDSPGYYRSEDDYHVIKYYLNESLSHEVNQKLGKFRYDDFKRNGVRQTSVSLMKNQLMVSRLLFKDGLPFGEWIRYNQRGKLRYKLDFNDVCYEQRDGRKTGLDFPDLSAEGEAYAAPQFELNRSKLERKLLKSSVLPRELRLHEL